MFVRRQFAIGKPREESPARGTLMIAAANRLLDVAALAYEAALDPALWHEVARNTCRAFDAAHVRIGLVDRCTGPCQTPARTPKAIVCSSGGFLGQR